MIKDVADMIADRTNDRIQEGKFSKFMSLEGLAALMFDKLQRWFETKDVAELEELAVDGFLVLLKSVQDEAMGSGKTQKDS